MRVIYWHSSWPLASQMVNHPVKLAEVFFFIFTNAAFNYTALVQIKSSICEDEKKTCHVNTLEAEYWCPSCPMSTTQKWIISIFAYFSRHTYSGSPSWGPQPTCFQAGRRGPFSQFLFCLGNVPNANEGKVLSFLLSLGSPLGNRVIEIILKWCDQDEDLSCPKWRPVLTKMITYHELAYHDQTYALSWLN